MVGAWPRWPTRRTCLSELRHPGPGIAHRRARLSTEGRPRAEEDEGSAWGRVGRPKNLRGEPLDRACLGGEAGPREAGGGGQARLLTRRTAWGRMAGSRLNGGDGGGLGLRALNVVVSGGPQRFWAKKGRARPVCGLGLRPGAVGDCLWHCLVGALRGWWCGGGLLCHSAMW
ncbi:hypothetical protein NDU88_002421 [Pleurodeles waltl]|uniref:Uncharacterized protein n=1 Tax=Pleurodeles waltl TaxID=8319 RepID=A0AAV7LP95_PLEWA|nr:hypothetical protein NDU88_002421 [Pleurodeles waltl]